MRFRYQIHPAIGVARVGDSDDYYYAPERPGGLPILPDGRPFTPADFRDGARRLRRQAVRFRVFRFDTERPDDPGEEVVPGHDGVESIEWTVHLANKKPIWYEFQVLNGEFGYPPDHPLRNAAVRDPQAREAMIIDPGPRSVSRPGERREFSRDDNPAGYPMTFPPEDLEPYTIDTLGGILCDERGHLVVLGGHGRSGSRDRPVQIVDYANNDGWWDDTADGPVTARLHPVGGGEPIDVGVASWVLVAPPRFAPELVNLVTLWDTIFDTAVRRMGYRPDIYRDELWQRDYWPSWEDEVEPILRRASRYPWVVAIPPHAHAFDFAKLGDRDPRYDGLRQYYLGIVRPASGPNLSTAPAGGLPVMPFLAGDNCFEPGPFSSTFLTLTATQTFFLEQWAAGRFRTGERQAPPPGEALDRAALENCVGGAFSPGIEMTWISRDPRLYSQPFRLRHKPRVRPPLALGQDAAGLEPGDACKYMAVPWQADFNECSQQPVGRLFLWWWPVQRPIFVHTRHGEQLRQVPWVGTAADQNAGDYVQFGDDLEMVRLWNELGFVFNEGGEEEPRFVEVERVLPRPPWRDVRAGS